MWERYTQAAKIAVKQANEEARHYRHRALEPEHLLLGILRNEEAYAVRLLKYLQVPIADLRDAIVAKMTPGEAEVDDFPFSGPVKKVLEGAYHEHRALGEKFIGTEHLLLALLKAPRSNTARQLHAFKVTHPILLRTIREFGSRRAATGHALEGAPEGTYPEEFVAGDPTSRSHTLGFMVGMIPFDRFSTAAARALIQTADLGMRAEVREVDRACCFLGLLGDPGCAAGVLLTDMGIAIPVLATTLETMFSPDPDGPTRRPASEDLQEALHHSAAVAEDRWPSPYITSVHLLYGLLLEPRGDFRRLAEKYGLTAPRVGDAASKVLSRLDPAWLPLERLFPAERN